MRVRLEMSEKKERKKKKRSAGANACTCVFSWIRLCALGLFVTSTTDALPPRKHFCRRILERERETARYIILFPTTSGGGGIQIFVSKTIEGKLGSIISISVRLNDRAYT